MKTINFILLSIFLLFISFNSMSQKIIVASESNECTYIAENSKKNGLVYEFDLDNKILNLYKNSIYTHSVEILKSKSKNGIIYVVVTMSKNKQKFIINKMGSELNQPVLVINNNDFMFYYWDDLDVNF